MKPVHCCPIMEWLMGLAAFCQLRSIECNYSSKKKKRSIECNVCFGLIWTEGNIFLYSNDRDVMS